MTFSLDARVLSEVEEHLRSTGDRALDPLQLAILLEDSLGLSLSDQQLRRLSSEGRAVLRDLVAGTAAN